MASSEPEEPRRLSRGRLSRGKGLRKTTGCLTCRRRHIKCDEVKPKCGGCVKKMTACVYGSREPNRSATAKSASQSKPIGDSTVGAPNRADANHDTNMDGSHVNGDGSSATEAAEAPVVSDTAHSELQPPSENIALSPEAHQVAGSTAHLSHDDPAATGDPMNVSESHVSADFNETQAAVTPHLGQYAHDYRSTRRRYSQVRPMRYDGPSPSQLSSHSALLHLTGASDTSTNGVVESPTSRWLDLLIGDATLNSGTLPEYDFEAGGFDVFGNSVVNTPGLEAPQAAHVNGNQAAHQLPPARTRNTWLQERIPYPRYEQLVERQTWQTSGRIELQPHEHVLFRHFVGHLSQWMDLFEPRKPFGAYVPRLALHNVGLMNAILALSARHLSLDGCDRPAYAGNLALDPNDAVGYYYKTLHYSQKAMQYDTYKTSLELLAISLIISTYEMLDGSSTDWEKHLEGVFWIQRSQVIHGDSGGLRQTVWWTWLCQDVWAAFREKRKPFTFWSASRTLEDLDPPEIAARSVYNFAQVVGYCSRKEREARTKDLAYRAFEADILLQKLDDWKRFLTFEFDPLPLPSTSDTMDEAFQPVWIHPPAYAVAMQLYYCSLILIYLNRPLGGGLDDYLEQQRQLKRCSKMVCSIATTLSDYASSIMSSQCVFIAGMTISDSNQRAAVLDLLEKCRWRTGWPGRSLGEELTQIWNRSDQTEG